MNVCKCYLVRDANGVKVAIMRSLDKTNPLPIHEPRTISYWDDKKCYEISEEEFARLHNTIPFK